jgi:hypothetical protein
MLVNVSCFLLEISKNLQIFLKLARVSKICSSFPILNKQNKISDTETEAVTFPRRRLTSMFSFKVGGWVINFLSVGSAGTKLTLNQDFNYGKEDYVSQKTLMLVFTKLNWLNEARLVVRHFVFC